MAQSSTNVFRRAAGRFSSAGANAGIFKDERNLLPDYVPTEILHRENEINDIASSINRIIEGGKCENLMIVGPPGTGKTVTMNHILEQLKEYTQKIEATYVNCWQNTTRFSILSKIAEDLGMFVPRRGVSVDEMLTTVVEGYTKKNLAGLIIVLDEFDRLFASFRDESLILYDLSRSAETLGVNIIVIAVSNRKDLLAHLDERIRSSFYPRTIEFKPYDSIALKDILRERAKYAFRLGVLDEEVIPLCAAIGLKRGGDARVAIKALWLAGRQAESEGSSKVNVGDVNDIRKGLEDVAVKEYRLSDAEKKILGVLKSKSNSAKTKNSGKQDNETNEKNTITSGELYKELSRLNITDRAIRYYLTRLEKMGLIKSQIKEGRGRTRIFSAKN